MSKLIPLYVLLFLVGFALADTSILYDANDPLLSFAAAKLNKSIAGVHADTMVSEIRLIVDSRTDTTQTSHTLLPEGYHIIPDKERITVRALDSRGAMYGALDLFEQIRIVGDLQNIQAKQVNPRFPFRAIKFNLPWSSYRRGEHLQMHMSTVRDLDYWADFLDMMALNRFNALTLWNLHPFTFLIVPDKYPEAAQFTGAEMDEWKTFWHTLFRMAKDRGIETYLVNWNIFVSPQMRDAHQLTNYFDDFEYNYDPHTPADTSPIIVDYTRECVTQVINEYPNLTGLGVSIGERMKMPINDALQWIKDTFVAGMHNANRKVKFIHRAPFSIHPQEARKYIESYTEIPEPIIMEFKFNWSHGHSTPRLSMTHGGQVKDEYWNPPPKNYKMAWMIRNEDFYMLNWGSPEFIRSHIQTNGQDYVTGYFVGSECYIPAKEYRMKKDVDYNWQYAFEKQWEFYQMWGHLLFYPDLPDQFFVDQLNLRYGNNVGAPFFEALQLGSRMPLRLASFYRSTWDWTLYSEGFLNGKKIYRTYKEPGQAFITVLDLMSSPTLDPHYVSIKEFVEQPSKYQKKEDSHITPLELADMLEADGTRALQLLASLKPAQDPINYKIERTDIMAWSYLSLYFAEKLRAGVALQQAILTHDRKRQQSAIRYLKEAASHWQALSEVTDSQYQEVSLAHLQTYKFSWSSFQHQVLNDIEIAETIFE